jgi:arsenate reductase-like glutaredoxin family protein
MTVTIYHNPKCGTSRNVLAMIRASGEEPEVIEYLKTPPGTEKMVGHHQGDRRAFGARDPAPQGHAL